MSEWRDKENALEKLFTFNDFNEALVFVNKVGAIAEELQHHPTITMKNYNKVLISTTTHDAGNTVSEKDHSLVRRIDESIGQ